METKMHCNLETTFSYLVASLPNQQILLMAAIGILYTIFGVWVWHSHYKTVFYSSHFPSVMPIQGTEKSVRYAHRPVFSWKKTLSTCLGVYKMAVMGLAFLYLGLAEIWYFSILYSHFKAGVTETQWSLDRDFSEASRVLLEGWVVKGVHYTAFKITMYIVMNHLKSNIKLNKLLSATEGNEESMDKTRDMYKLYNSIYKRITSSLFFANLVAALCWYSLRMVEHLESYLVVVIVLINGAICGWELTRCDDDELENSQDDDEVVWNLSRLVESL